METLLSRFPFSFPFHTSKGVIMRKYIVNFADTREESKTKGQVLCSYNETASLPNEALEQAFPKFFKDHPDFDPAQSGCVESRVTTVD